MRRRDTSHPKYRLHRASGQAVVTLAGKDHYLAKYGTKSRRIFYDRRVDEYATPLLADRFPVRKLWIAWMQTLASYTRWRTMAFSEGTRMHRLIDCSVDRHRHSRCRAYIVTVFVCSASIKLNLPFACFHVDLENLYNFILIFFSNCLIVSVRWSFSNSDFSSNSNQLQPVCEICWLSHSTLIMSSFDLLRIQCSTFFSTDCSFHTGKRLSELHHELKHNLDHRWNRLCRR